MKREIIIKISEIVDDRNTVCSLEESKEFAKARLRYNFSNDIEIIDARDIIYTWKDVVKIGNEIHAEEFEISGEMDDDTHYDISNFLHAVAEKYNVDVDDVKTYIMDNIEFDPDDLPFNELPIGAEDCGCYINGVAEWLIEN